MGAQHEPSLGKASRDPPHFRALDSKMTRLLGFRCVSGNGLGTADFMPGTVQRPTTMCGFDFATMCTHWSRSSLSYPLSRLVRP
jgi:hypothetical protein